MWKASRVRDWLAASCNWHDVAGFLVLNKKKEKQRKEKKKEAADASSALTRPWAAKFEEETDERGREREMKSVYKEIRKSGRWESPRGYAVGSTPFRRVWLGSIRWLKFEWNRSRFLPSFISFYWVTIGFSALYRIVVLEFYWFSFVLPSFTGFYRVLLSSTQFQLWFIGFFTWFYCFTVFYWALPGFTGFYWVLLGFIGFYWVLLGSVRFYWIFFQQIPKNRIVAFCFKDF